MIKTSILLALVLWASVCYGAAPDRRISDNDGDVADITSAGLLRVSTTNTPGAGDKKNAPDRRISGNTGNVVNITSSGALQLS